MPNIYRPFPGDITKVHGIRVGQAQNEEALTGVTVVCPDGARADALSTALFVLGEQGALELWRQAKDFELLLVTADGRAVVTPGLTDSFAPAAGAGYTLEIAG